MKFSYIRPTKLHPEPEQRAALDGFAFDEEYLDAKPRRGEPSWYSWDKIVHACRPGSGDEIHVSHASVIADSVPIALKKLGDIAAREATLVIASTGLRYTWHPDAADAMGLAIEMQREARRLVAKIGGDAFARSMAAKRKRDAAKLREIKRMWLDPTVITDDVVKFSKMSRNALYKRYGPRGTALFGKAENAP